MIYSSDPHHQLSIDNLRNVWRAMDTIGRTDLYCNAGNHRKPTTVTAFTRAAARAGYRVTVIVEPILDPKENLP